MNPSLAAVQVDISQIDLPEHASSEHASSEHAAAVPLDAAQDRSARRLPLDMLGEIAVKVEIRLGTARLTVKELMELRQGTTLELEQHLHQDADVLLNERVIARGELVAVGDHFGVRITELAAS